MNSTHHYCSNSKIIGFLSFLLLLLLPYCCCISIDSIAPNQTLKDGDVLVSSRKHFALGFFTPGNSGKRYVGVWYNKVPEKTIVWVANRDSPLDGTSGVLAIDGEGGLVIYNNDSDEVPVWSANVTLSSPNTSMAKLLDTGNFVLYELENGSSRVLWEGFDNPSNTLLPFMKLGLNRKTGLNRFLTSWKSLNDPGTGNCTYRIDPSGNPQLFLYKGGAPWWRSGSWIGHRWSGVPVMTPNFIFNISFVNNHDELSVVYGITNDTIFSKMVIDESGTVGRATWHDRVRQWAKFWSAPVEQCDMYGTCGPNGNCNPYNSDKFECTCLPGFGPKSAQDWYLRDGSGGCVRNKGSVSMCRNGEGFVKVSLVKAPDSSTAKVNMTMSLQECEEECLRNCSCMAYSNAEERQGGWVGCVTWFGDLVDTRTYNDVGQDLYVRVDSIDLAKYAKKSSGSLSKKKKVAISITSILVFFLVISITYWSVKKKRKELLAAGKETPSIYLGDSSSRYTNPDDSSRLKTDLPFFELNTISAATNNFSNSNRLGEGGFGPVYKGVLPSGTEIAVKRLCKNSGQGNEEFKNEVVLIAKLQHRNLVRILGYCIQDEEKMLIYEYLPNKSLDSFIFNETKKAFLDWPRRLEIIFGIARGILYLHQDSRLRIIHRDLKASNVLLDSDMNPKIADFGMARIFGVNQIEANTNRVVGTYGYMSPEYAMDGIFSVKSDVYSFGVLLLEIVSGNKNTGYYFDNPDSNLVGHVWDLWKEDRALEIIDISMGESYSISEVMRCINIALLCVQEFPNDRPTMSAVIGMLGSDAALPSPRKPAFLLKRSNYTSSGEPSTGDANSINYVSCTGVEGR